MNKNNISRRSFLKVLGLGGAVVAAPAIVSCAKGDKPTDEQEPPVGKMTYRKNPKTGEQVSLLGYGMMRLPTIKQNSAREDGDAEIDQDMVNQQVDYAIAHGINYFDT